MHCTGWGSALTGGSGQTRQTRRAQRPRLTVFQRQTLSRDRMPTYRPRMTCNTRAKDSVGGKQVQASLLQPADPAKSRCSGALDR